MVCRITLQYTIYIILILFYIILILYSKGLQEINMNELGLFKQGFALRTQSLSL